MIKSWNVKEKYTSKLFITSETVTMVETTVEAE